MTKPEDRFYVIDGAHLAYLERLAERLNRSEPFERNPDSPWNQREVQKTLTEVVIPECKETEVEAHGLSYELVWRGPKIDE
jgi:hypothetical protein